jgi:very-short-patch-repair endonuclease
MLLVGLIALGSLLFLALVALARDMGSHDDRWPVYAKGLLSEREQTLYKRLETICPHHVVLAQVALSQLIHVKSGIRRPESLRGRYQQLVADFVLCRPDFSVAAVIELDDSTHERAIQRKRDANKTRAVESAGIRMVRLPAGTIPTEAELRQILSEEICATGNSAAMGTDTRSNAKSNHGVSWRPIRNVAGIVVLIAGGWTIYSRLPPLLVSRVIGAQPVVSMTRPVAASAASVQPAPPIPKSGVMHPGANEQLEAKQLEAQTALAAEQAAEAQAKQKRDAWTAYYAAPASCEHPAAWSEQVECGNQYMRAKKEFEQRWRAQLTLSP